MSGLRQILVPGLGAERHYKHADQVNQAERRGVGVGDDFPFSAPALMQAFHAWRDQADFDLLADRVGVRPFTEHTVTDRTELHEQLAETRNRGFSTSLQQFDLAQSGVAIGALIAACADRITQRIGGKSPILSAEGVGPDRG